MTWCREPNSPPHKGMRHGPFFGYTSGRGSWAATEIPDRWRDLILLRKLLSHFIIWRITRWLSLSRENPPKFCRNRSRCISLSARCETERVGNRDNPEERDLRERDQWSSAEISRSILETRSHAGRSETHFASGSARLRVPIRYRIAFNFSAGRSFQTCPLVITFYTDARLYHSEIILFGDGCAVHRQSGCTTSAPAENPPCRAYRGRFLLFLLSFLSRNRIVRETWWITGMHI